MRRLRTRSSRPLSLKHKYACTNLDCKTLLRNTFRVFSFVKRFPVQIALVALLLYVSTISHGVTLTSLPMTAKLAGWDWQPMFDHPLLWLVTLPLRLLPTTWIPLAFNLLSAILAAVVLGILARSLKLIDPELLGESVGWRGKLSVLLACVVCGLEYNFWRDATAATGEMLSLLLFAAAIWCLLEFRANHEFQWLQTATFIWGLGLAENWMMMLLLPLFVVLVFWFGRDEMGSPFAIFLTGVTALAGFSILFLPPLVSGLLPHSPWGVGEAIGMALKNFKGEFGTLYFQFWLLHREMMIVVMVFFLGIAVLPVIARRRSGRTKRVLDQWIDKMLLLSQIVLGLLICVWLAFDPLIGPRQLVLRQTKMAFPFLSLDYVAALCAGYVAANLLLVLRQRRHSFKETFSRRIANPVFAVFLILVAAGLFLRNAPAIVMVNGEPLTQFEEVALRSLPTGGGIVLSDESRFLMAFQAAAALHGNRQWIAVDTQFLSSTRYRKQLARKYPADWMTADGQGDLTPPELLGLVERLAQTNRIYYLHESFGYLFETYYLEPAGSVFQLKAYPERAINPRPLSDTAIDATEQIWDNAAPQINDLVQSLQPSDSSLARTIGKAYAMAQLQPVPRDQSQVLAQFYSVALNDWGVQLQRAGRLAAAQKRFGEALELNTNNLAAMINLACNTNLALGNKMNLADVRTVAGEMGDPPHVSPFIQGSGMVDNPSFCYLLGNALVEDHLPHQAILQLERANQLAPDVVAPKLALAELYTRLGLEDRARRLIAMVRSEESSYSDKDTFDPGLYGLEAESWFLQTNTANATGVLRSLLQEHPNDPRAQNLAMRAYMAFGDYSNALRLINIRVKADPSNVPVLLDQAVIYRKLGALTNSIASFNYALAVTNLPYIHLMRDDAYVQAGQLDAAESDYQAMDLVTTNHVIIYFALADIAGRRHDTNGAITWLERCLGEVPANSAEYQMLEQRILSFKQTGSATE